jgi:hypothetical protein
MDDNFNKLVELAKNHNTEIVSTFDKDCDWYFYTSEGACGYPVYVSTSDNNKLTEENIYTVLGESVYGLAEAIMDDDVKKLSFVEASEELLEQYSEELFDELDS